MTAAQTHAQSAPSLDERVELAEQLSLVAIEMIFTLGAEFGRRFDFGAYADVVVRRDDRDEPAGNRRLAEKLRQIAAALDQATTPDTRDVLQVAQPAAQRQ